MAERLPDCDGPPREARFYELDILRGVAALMVVAFHYKHFLFISDEAGFDYLKLPLFRALEPVYVYGQFFVELFFAISGYVFFWLYARAIANRSTSGADFLIARFSRLYPLYLLTFLVAAGIQWCFHALYGYDYIYQHNGPRNFGLNLFLAQQWWPHPELSFNGPAWSISVEAFLYAVFFALCFFRLCGWRVTAAMVAIGLVWKYAAYDPQNDFVRGIPAFFLGGLVWYAVTWLKQHEAWRRRVALGLCAVVPVLWLIAYGRTAAALWASELIPPPFDMLSGVFSTETFIYVCVPLTLLLFGLMQGLWKTSMMQPAGLHRWSWLGDISYSVYLIHFPLQLLLMLVLTHWPLEVRTRIFAAPVMFVAFMALACALAWLSYRFFEMPARRWLRERLSRLVARLFGRRLVPQSPMR